MDKKFLDNERLFKNSQKTIRAIQIILEKQFQDVVAESESSESNQETVEQDDGQSFYRQDSNKTDANTGRNQGKAGGGKRGAKNNVKFNDV